MLHHTVEYTPVTPSGEQAPQSASEPINEVSAPARRGDPGGRRAARERAIAPLRHSFVAELAYKGLRAHSDLLCEWRLGDIIDGLRQLADELERGQRRL